MQANGINKSIVVVLAVVSSATVPAALGQPASGIDLQLPIQPAQMGMHRMPRHVELHGHLLFVEPLEERADDLLLARRQSQLRSDPLPLSAAERTTAGVLLRYRIHARPFGPLHRPPPGLGRIHRLMLRPPRPTNVP